MFPCQIYIFSTIRSMAMVLKISKLNKVNFRAIAQTLNYFLLFAYSLLLLAINQFVWMENHLWSPVVEVIWCSGCFITSTGVQFPTIELDNTIWFSTLSKMSGFLRHSSKWACWFSCFLQYKSGLEVLGCSLNNDLNYVTTMFQLHPSLNQ